MGAVQPSLNIPVVLVWTGPDWKMMGRPDRLRGLLQRVTKQHYVVLVRWRRADGTLRDEQYKFNKYGGNPDRGRGRMSIGWAGYHLDINSVPAEHRLARE